MSNDLGRGPVASLPPQLQCAVGHILLVISNDSFIEIGRDLANPPRLSGCIIFLQVECFEQSVNYVDSEA